MSRYRCALKISLVNEVLVGLDWRGLIGQQKGERVGGSLVVHPASVVVEAVPGCVTHGLAYDPPVCGPVVRHLSCTFPQFKADSMGGLDQKHATMTEKDGRVDLLPQKATQQRFVRGDTVGASSGTEQLKGLGLHQGTVKQWRS